MKKIKKKDLKKIFDKTLDVCEPITPIIVMGKKNEIHTEAYLLLSALTIELNHSITGLTTFLRKVNQIATSQGLTGLTKTQLCYHLKNLREEKLITRDKEKEKQIQQMSGPTPYVFKLTEAGNQIVKDIAQRMTQKIDVQSKTKEIQPILKPVQRLGRNLETQKRK